MLSCSKINILPPISDNILPQLCSDDFVPNVKNQTIFRTIIRMALLEHNYSNISPKMCTNMQGYMFSLDCSDGLNNSHKFTNFILSYILRHSIIDCLELFI